MNVTLKLVGCTFLVFSLQDFDFDLRQLVAAVGIIPQ